MAFTASEVELCLQIARDATLGSTVRERLAASTEAFTALVPGSSLSVIVVDRAFARPPAPEHLFVRNFELPFLAEYARTYMKRDPMYRDYLEATGKPSCMSDYIAAREFGRDEFTGHFCPRARVHHVLGCVHPLPGDLVMGLALHRERGMRDFTAKEREVLRLVSPHVARGCSGSILRERLLLSRATSATAPATATSGVVLFDATGDVLHADEGARALLARIEGDVSGADLFVGEVRRIVAGAPAEGSAFTRTLPLVDGRWLKVRLSPLESGAHGKVMAVLEVVAGDSTAALEALAVACGLSPREREVALLASRGKGNREIAGELGIAAATVGVHLGSIYRKTGLSNRTYLAAVVLGGAPLPERPRRFPRGPSLAE